MRSSIPLLVVAGGTMSLFLSKMTTPTRALSQKKQDMLMMRAEVHLRTKNYNFRMERYALKRFNNEIYTINL